MEFIPRDTFLGIKMPLKILLNQKNILKLLFKYHWAGWRESPRNCYAPHSVLCEEPFFIWHS